jgi:predicted HAD superfamily Cof-like phosphohydrolase
MRTLSFLPHNQLDLIPMQTFLENVRDFHRQIGAPIAEAPALLSCQQQTAVAAAEALREVLGRFRAMERGDEQLLVRLCLAIEELAEWAEAHAAGDLVAAADAWGDRLYVLLGDAVSAGLPAVEIFAEVHRSNRTKSPVHAQNAGKGTKAVGYEPPQLRKLLGVDGQECPSYASR